MENDLREKRMDAYRNSSLTAQALYEDFDLGRAYIEISKKYALPEEKHDKFVDLVGDIILGFYPKSDFKKLLVNEVKVTEDVAKQIEIDLKDFLARIDGAPAVSEASKDVKEKLELRPEGSVSKPLTREEVLQALAPKRTMASDIASVKKGEDAVSGEMEKGTEESAPL